MTGPHRSMTIELPILRLGLAGFSAGQQEQLHAALESATPGAIVWKLGKLGSADAWWVNGSRVTSVSGATVCIAAAEAADHAVQLHLPDIDRPVAFSTPIACAELEPRHTFDMSSVASVRKVLQKFEAWLSPLTTQFCLASHLVEHDGMPGGGVFDVMLDGRLLAVVDMRGDVGVVPGAGPAEFEDAEWRRRPRAPLPAHLLRTSISQLMWQYCVRTTRDLLPRHYRTGPLYFRRPPRLPNRMLADSHLLLMRELACGPAGFETLRERTRMQPLQLARDLAALYFVGSITANPKRAAPSQQPRRPDAPESGPGSQSSLISGIDSLPPGEPAHRMAAPADLTAPAPMCPS